MLLPSGRPAANALVMVREPRGSSRLGEKVACTGPDGSFTLSGLPTGEYQVQARKVNFEDFSATAVILDGETPTLVEGTLVDRLEQYYLEAIRAEPKKISHFTELAHWYFINNRMDQAVEFYRRGLDLAVDRRLHVDARRHDKEIRKHLGWSTGDPKKLAYFREKMKAVMAALHNLRYKHKRKHKPKRP